MRKFLLIYILMIAGVLNAQDEVRHLKGKIYDNISKEALPGVILLNIYTGRMTTSDSNGNFELDMKNEELIEFQMIGYKTSRIRMKSYITASYYSIGLTKELPPIEIKVDSSFEADSTRLARFYSKELSVRKLTPSEVIDAPWELASKTYRAKIKFKETFNSFIEQRYIDEYFNEKFIRENSPLTGDDLENFLIFYRPSPEFARSMSKYEFMLWVKNMANQYYKKRQYQQIQHQ